MEPVFVAVSRLHPFENSIFTRALGTLTKYSSRALYALRIIFPSNSEGF